MLLVPVGANKSPPAISVLGESAEFILLSQLTFFFHSSSPGAHWSTFSSFPRGIFSQNLSGSKSSGCPPDSSMSSCSLLFKNYVGAILRKDSIILFGETYNSCYYKCYCTSVINKLIYVFSHVPTVVVCTVHFNTSELFCKKEALRIRMSIRWRELMQCFAWTSVHVNCPAVSHTLWGSVFSWLNVGDV